MKFTKLELAKIQLERAISLFLNDGDFVSAVTLAEASEEITRKMLKREGKDPAISELKDWLADNHPHSDFWRC